MPVASITPTPNTSGRQITRFQTSLRMSTYLVAFIVSDFEAISTVSANGIPPLIYCRAATAAAVGFFDVGGPP